jgi:hypothetical protein
VSIHRRTVPDEVFNHQCRPLKMLRNIEETKVFLKKVLAQNPEETGSWRFGILKKPGSEDLESWRKMRHTEDMSRWRSSWSVVFVKSFSFLSRRKTSYCWRGWRKRVPKVWRTAQLGILKKTLRKSPAVEVQSSGVWDVVLQDTEVTSFGWGVWRSPVRFFWRTWGERIVWPCHVLRGVWLEPVQQRSYPRAWE